MLYPSSSKASTELQVSSLATCASARPAPAAGGLFTTDMPAEGILHGNFADLVPPSFFSPAANVTSRVAVPTAAFNCLLLVQAGLIKRGFQVTRLNTYDTLPVTGVDAATLAMAKSAPVLTIASPSAIK